MTQKTFSFDAHVINLNVFSGITLPLRYDCDGAVRTISEKGQSHIYLTNYCAFNRDKLNFSIENQDSAKSNLRGMQFDVIMNWGYLFNSYTYIPGSMRMGGFSEYALK